MAEYEKDPVLQEQHKQFADLIEKKDINGLKAFYEELKAGK